MKEIEDTAEYANEWSMDSYNRDIYTQNKVVSLQRQIWTLEEYHTNYTDNIFTLDLNDTHVVNIF